MLSVYRVLADLDKYQFVAPDDSKVIADYSFDGRRLRDAWKSPEVYVPHPLSAKGDFWGCFWHSEIFAVTLEAAQKVVTFLDQSCETLPLYYQEGKLLICNVINVLNCLDKKNSRHKPGIPDWIDNYVFHPRRFEYSLFKIPETRMSEVLCVEGIAAPGDEFKGRVESLGLTGLRFQRIWAE
jgi:hypothetical protein